MSALPGTDAKLRGNTHAPTPLPACICPEDTLAQMRAADGGGGGFIHSTLSNQKQTQEYTSQSNHPILDKTTNQKHLTESTIIL